MTIEAGGSIGQQGHPGLKKIRVVEPRDFIARLRAQYPGENDDAIRERYKQHVCERAMFDDSAIKRLVMAPLDEWLKSVLDKAPPATPLPAAPAPKPKRSKTVEEREQARAATNAIVGEIAKRDEKRIEREVTIRLLEYQTTYEKPLGDCTGAECRRLSIRYGVFFAEIAKRLRPSDHVRHHLTEAELQAIAVTHRLIGPKAGE